MAVTFWWAVEESSPEFGKLQITFSNRKLETVIMVSLSSRARLELVVFTGFFGLRHALL